MIHVIIATERRSAPRELAINIKGQLHMMGQSVVDLASSQIIYAASWDMTSPFVRVLKGSIADIKMQFAGWPMVDEATWRAQNPEVTP